MSEVAERPISFGEILVGVNFNPAQDPKVAKAKQLCAELANLVNDHQGEVGATYGKDSLQHYIHERATMDILAAQMMVVKLLTLKY